MTEVFSQWKSGLKNEYSWKKLAEVLVSPAVNETELMGHIYKELTATMGSSIGMYIIKHKVASFIYFVVSPY